MLSSGVLLRDVMRKNAKTGDGCFIAVLRDQTRGEIALRCQSNTGEWLTNDCHGCVAHPWSERSWRSDVKRPDMVGTEVGGSNPQSDVEATALHRTHFARHVRFARFLTAIADPFRSHFDRSQAIDLLTARVLREKSYRQVNRRHAHHQNSACRKNLSRWAFRVRRTVGSAGDRVAFRAAMQKITWLA